MTCYDIVVDFDSTIDLMVICNLKMACYKIVVDFEIMIDLFNNL